MGRSRSSDKTIHQTIGRKEHKERKERQIKWIIFAIFVFFFRLKIRFDKSVTTFPKLLQAERRGRVLQRRLSNICGKQSAALDYFVKRLAWNPTKSTTHPAPCASHFDS
jgi:hypothetical protein